MPCSRRTRDSEPMNDAPLIVHLIYRLDFGGLESLLVERINRMPANAYRHAIVCLTDSNPAFARKITRTDVAIHMLHKRPGQSPGTHVALWRLLREDNLLCLRKRAFVPAITDSRPVSLQPWMRWNWRSMK